MLPFPTTECMCERLFEKLADVFGTSAADLDLCTLCSLRLPPGHGVVATCPSTWKASVWVSVKSMNSLYYASVSDERTRIEGRTGCCLTFFWLSLPALDEPPHKHRQMLQMSQCAHSFIHFPEIAVRSHPSIA